MKALLILILAMITGTSFAGDGYAVGDVATDFNLMNINGEKIAMADYTDANGFIVIFTCNHCPYSVAYEDRIIALDRKFSSEGFPVIAINPNDAEKYPSDSFEGMKTRASEKGFTFPYLHDETQEIAKKYGALRTPHVFLLERQMSGDLVVKYIGAIDDKPYSPDEVEERFLENAVKALQEGNDPNPNFVKAIGCSIKWK
jgi:peroxiredoxin